MDILFDNASLLNLTYNFQLLGGNFNFRNEKKLDIQGELVLNSFSGVVPIWSGIKSGLAEEDYNNVILNGISFGSGKVNSIDFEKGLDVNRKKYTASITVYESGNLNDLVGDNYAGLLDAYVPPAQAYQLVDFTNLIANFYAGVYKVRSHVDATQATQIIHTYGGSYPYYTGTWELGSWTGPPSEIPTPLGWTVDKSLDGAFSTDLQITAVSDAFGAGQTQLSWILNLVMNDGMSDLPWDGYLQNAAFTDGTDEITAYDGPQLRIQYPNDGSILDFTVTINNNTNINTLQIWDTNFNNYSTTLATNATQVANALATFISNYYSTYLTCDLVAGLIYIKSVAAGGLETILCTDVQDMGTIGVEFGTPVDGLRGILGLQYTDLRYLESLNETFNFVSDENKIYNYTRDVSIQMESGIGTNPVYTAQSLALLLLKNDVIFPFINEQYPGFYSNGKKFYRESYNLTKGQYDFSERFKFQSGLPYTWVYSTISKFQEKESVITEKGEIEGLSLDDYDEALNAYTGTIVGGVFDRCSGSYLAYIGTGCNLLNTPIDQRLSINKVLGTISYEFSYSNNPKNQSGCIWEYTIGSSKEQDGTYMFYEEGNIKGIGKKTYPTNQQYLNALAFYSGVQPLVVNHLSGLLTGVSLTSGHCISGLYPQESGITESEFNGFVNYSFKYSSNNNFLNQSGIKYLVASYRDSSPVPLANTYGILHDSEVVAPMSDGNSTLGTFSTNVRGRTTSGIENINSAFLGAIGKIVAAPGTDKFYSNVELTYGSKNGDFTADFEETYVRNKTFTDHTP